MLTFMSKRIVILHTLGSYLRPDLRGKRVINSSRTTFAYVLHPVMKEVDRISKSGISPRGAYHGHICQARHNVILMQNHDSKLM